jgi:hypothetical protein
VTRRCIGVCTSERVSSGAFERQPLQYIQVAVLCLVFINSQVKDWTPLIRSYTTVLQQHRSTAPHQRAPWPILLLKAAWWTRPVCVGSGLDHCSSAPVVSWSQLIMPFFFGSVHKNDVNKNTLGVGHYLGRMGLGRTVGAASRTHTVCTAACIHIVAANTFVNMPRDEVIQISVGRKRDQDPSST